MVLKLKQMGGRPVYTRAGRLASKTSSLEARPVDGGERELCTRQARVFIAAYPPGLF